MVTPFTFFKRFNASAFSAATFLFLCPLIVATLPTDFSNASLSFFFFFLSLFLKACFSLGVYSERARRSAEAGAKISSGARSVEADLIVGRADSRDAVGTFVIEDMIALGYDSTSA
jgi:hypothetical protein